MLFAAGTLSILLTRVPGGISLFWPGSVIAACLLIRAQRVRWVSAAILLWLSVFLANLAIAARPALVAALFASINLGEIGLMTVAFARVWRLPYPDISIAQATFMTALLGVAIPGLASLPAGYLLAVLYGQPFADGVSDWWSSHALGACLFGPPMILFSGEAMRRLLRSTFLTENLALLLICVAVVYIAVSDLRFPFVLIGLFLLVSAFRVGGLGAATLSLVAGLVVIVLWARGVRPIGLADSSAAMSTLVGLPVVPLLASLMAPIAVGIGTDARRAGAAALRSSQRHFREAMESSPVGILIADLDGTWRHCNRSLCLMLGYTREELSGLPAGGPSVGEEWQDSKPRWQRLLNGEIDSYSVERRFRHKEGRWIWTHVSVSLMRAEDGAPLHLIAQIENLEAGREAELRLAQEHERLVTTLQAISDAVITTDTELRLTYINSAAESLLGVRHDEVNERRLDELLHFTDPLTLKTAPSLIRRSMASGSALAREGACILHRSDGTVRYVKDSVRPVMGPDGMLAGTVVVLRDVTHDRDREQELHRRASHDALTGLLGRGEFQLRLRELFQKSRYRERPAALIAIDLDRFKALNDAAGHAAGDAMLRKIAETCRGLVRSADAVARLGGDEFAILLEDCPERLTRDLSAQLVQLLNPCELNWQGTTHSVGASLGVATLSMAHESGEDWLAAADAACYRAKRAGRAQVHFAEAAAEVPAHAGAATR